MKERKSNFIFSIILLVISAALNVYLAFLLQMIIDSTSAHDVKALVKPILMTLVFMLLDLSVSIFAKHFSTKYIQNRIEIFKLNRFRFIFKNNDFRNEEEVKKELSSFSTDIDIVERDYEQEKFNIVFYSTQFLFALVAIISISWTMTLSIAVISLLLILVPNMLQNKVQKLQDEYSESASEYALFISESLNARQEIITYDVFESINEKHKQIDHKMEMNRKRIRFTTAAIGIVCTNLGFLSFVTALGLGAYYVIIGTMTFGYMIAAVQLMNNLMNPLNYLLSTLTSIKSTKNVVAKYHETPSLTNNGEKIVDNFVNEIEVKNLSFSYDPQKPVIKDLSFKLRKGQKTVIIGPSGCGKSTVAKILSGEIHDYGGTILYDGIPIKDIDNSSYHKNIRFVRQSPVIFTDTVLNNISFFYHDFDQSMYQRTLQLSKVNTYIKNPEDENRIINNSSGLSGGQLQRLTIARALLRNSPVLILDEFTSALDINTAYEIMKDILSIKDITCLIITHQCDEKIMGLFDNVITMD